MESGESEHGRTTRWETLEAKPGYWRGRVHVSHDPSLEEDGLLREARTIELSVVPTLFGHPHGVVTLLEKNDERQDFEVTWPIPIPCAARSRAASPVRSRVACAAHPATITYALAALAPIAGAAAGLFSGQSRLRKAESAAQSMRASARSSAASRSGKTC